MRLEAVFTALPSGKLSVIGQQLWEREYQEAGKVSKKELAEKLFATRKRWEERIQDRIENGRDLSLRHYRYYMAADMAFDSTPITPQKFFHMLYAKGDMKLDFYEMYTEVVKSSGTKIADEMFIKTDDGKSVIGINTPKLTDITINLVRPYVRRAVAAQVNRYENMYPFLKYESRSQGLQGKLRADIMSERAEIMTDQFGYRHLLGQEIRGMFLHSHSVSFVENSWSVTEQMRKIPDAANPRGFRMVERIEREGVRFKKVHPTRVFYDAHHALPSLNYDTGCQYVGFWDVIQYKDIRNNSGFFNVDRIPYSSSLHTYTKKYSAYFSQYYASTVKNIADRPTGAERNSRDANANEYYSDTIQDDCLWLTHYYERVTPKQEGLGGYPYPVWVHFVVAGDNTVVFAEVLPSRPAYVLHYDENDERLFNVSMALDILPYQDQISNLYSQVLYLLQVQNLLIMALDVDVVNEDIRKEFRKIIEGKKLFDKVHLMEFDSKVEELFEKPMTQKKPIEIFQADVTNIIRDLMGAIAETIQLLERNQMMSPNEMAQFVQRETSATEAQQVASSSSDLHAFKSSGIDAARQAMKVILYESLMACGAKEMRVSVPERYPDDVLNSMGFELDSDGNYSAMSPGGMTIIGTKEALAGEYIFSSRDGAERSSNTEAAKVLMELMRYIMGSEQTFQAFVETFGMEQITNGISEIFRMAGSPMTLKLPAAFNPEALKENMERSAGGGQDMEMMKQVMATVVERLRAVEAATGASPQQMQGQPPQQGQPMPPNMTQPMPQQQPMPPVPEQPMPPQGIPQQPPVPM